LPLLEGLTVWASAAAIGVSTLIAMALSATPNPAITAITASDLDACLIPPSACPILNPN
jgi:hypothetical protein